MSVFTMTLQEASEIFGDTPKDFGLDTFPVAKEFQSTEVLFRNTLANKIIQHYWNREIGIESFSMWRFNMRRAMNEIMPYYNKLYATELIAFDPLSTMNMTNESDSEQETDSTGSQTSAGASEARAKAIASDYPQTAIGQNATGNYATTGQDTINNGTNTGNADETRNEKGNASTKSTSKGYAGSAAALLTEYRSTLLNIDMMVVNDDSIVELFMSVLGTGDTYTGGSFL